MNSNYSNSIGSFLSALRKANGLTQKQLAEKLNVSDKAISRWERDECAPDLSLIPVLAELYGVTSDEILRGRRAEPSSESTPRSDDKSLKRLRQLLCRMQTKFKIQCIISVSLAVVGLIAAMILNIAFQRAQAGFLVGCIFYVAAVVCQVIFLILAFSNLSGEEFDTDAITQCRHGFIKGAELVFIIILYLFCSTCPLMLAGDPYWGITVPYSLGILLWILIIPTAICIPACYLINTRAGIWKGIDWKSPGNKLRFRCGAVLALVLAVTVIFHLLTAAMLSDQSHIFGYCTAFDSFDSFKAYIETPLSPDGEELTLYETPYEPFDGYVYTDSGGTYYEAEYYEYFGSSFYHANMTVIHFYLDGDTIYTYDHAQYNHTQNSFIITNWCIAVIYPLELIVAAVLYRKKKAKLL